MPLSEPKGIPHWTTGHPWLVAILSSVAMAALRVALNPILGDATPFITFFVAVALTAWVGGLWPGLLATALSAVLAIEVVFEPRFAFAINTPQQAAGIVLFGIVGALISFICEALHETRRVHERQKEWWRVTLASIGDAVIATDVEGRVTYLNAVACELTGWGPNEAIGAPLERVFDIVNETTRAVVENPVAKVMREGRAVGLANHTVLRRRDGTELPIDDSAAPIRGADGALAGIVMVFHDVSERRELERGRDDREKALQASQARLQLALNAADMFVWEVNLSSNNVTTTERGSEYFGSTRCRGDQIRNAIPLEDRDRVDRAWAVAVATGERYECEHRVTAPDGRVRWLHAMGINEHRADGLPDLLVGVSVDVTDRHASDEQLRYQLDLIRSITGNATTAIFMLDDHGRCTFMNPAAVEMTGFSFDEVSGTALHERMHHHRPDGRPYPIAECPLERPGADLRNHRDTFFRKSGEMFPVSCNARVIMRDGVATGTVLEVRDLTAELEADREARERSEQVRGLAEAALRLTTATDINGVLQVVSEEARRLVRAHQAATTTVRDGDWSSSVFFASLSDRFASWREYQRQPDGSGIYRLVCERNTPMRLTQEELEAHPAFRAFGDHEGKHPPLRGWLAAPLIARDGSNIGVLQLSDRIDGDFTADDEAVLVQLAQMASVAIENIRLVEDLRESDRRKDEFLSILAHELRNPLAPIRNGLHLLKLAGGDENTATMARNVMERQTNHLVRLIDDLMDLTRVSQGRLTLRKTRLPLMNAVHAALESAAPLFTEGGQSLALIAPGEPLIVDADETRLAQALGNILNNAAKYTPRGGHVSVKVERDDNEARVTIEDTGIGIPGPMRDRIFEMFTQVDRSLERARGGLGIGLAIVHRLIAQHGGSVVAESEGQDKGSRFIVRLPLVPTSGATAAIVQDGAAMPAGLSRRVLVVDDNRDAADSLHLMLEMMGHESFVAHDGPGAIERAESLRPDVILMDIGMPGLNGYDVCQRIRSAPWGKAIHMVACTGWGQPEDRQRALAAGFNDHRVKPIDPAAMSALLAWETGSRSAAQQGGAGATSPS